jgi:periplasmic divalent cation tolerance protein
MRVVVLVTAGSRKEGRKLAAALVGRKLAACINIIDGVESLFFWKGKTQSSRECLLVIKSRKDKLAQLTRLVKSMHSYDVPEIIALPIVAGDKEYLRWIDAVVG